MKLLNESMCCHVTGRSCNCLFRLLQKVVGCALALSDDFLLESEHIPTVGRVNPKICSIFLIEWRYS
jgi:hypothetical protein